MWKEESRLKNEELNGWCRNCDNREDCNHLNLPSCEDFMFRTDGEDFDYSTFVIVKNNPYLTANKESKIAISQNKQMPKERIYD